MKHGVFKYDCETGKETQYKNLRGIINHAHENLLDGAMIVQRADGGADLVLDFENAPNYAGGKHSWFTADFANFAICKDWMRSRRSMHNSGATLTIHYLDGSTLQETL